MKYSGLMLALLFSCLLGFPAVAHDYHASITDVKYNGRTQSLEVAVRVFTDDLENALSQRTKSKVVYQANSEKTNLYLANYLQANLAFELTKGKPLKYKFVGSEEEADAVWIYLEVPVQQAQLAQLYVKNAIFTEIFGDQMNIVNVNYKSKTESVMLQRGEETRKISF
ncbi:DUF6702 family protein [Pontibacter arcticus]|nr:DUF6702 family protein [Pontibacter arcticus]